MRKDYLRNTLPHRSCDVINFFHLISLSGPRFSLLKCQLSSLEQDRNGRAWANWPEQVYKFYFKTKNVSQDDFIFY